MTEEQREAVDKANKMRERITKLGITELKGTVAGMDISDVDLDMDDDALEEILFQRAGKTRPGSRGAQPKVSVSEIEVPASPVK